jgi:hypothetical protein
MPEALLWQTVLASGDADEVDDRLLLEAQYRLLEGSSGFHGVSC